MSMPEFPQSPDLDMENAIAQVVSSIAMEELALSHIINAEGEKIQFVLGTLHNHKPHTIEEILEVNESVKDMLSAVSMNQMFLFAKLSSANDMYKRFMKEQNGENGSTITGPTGGGGDITGLFVSGGRLLDKEIAGDRSDWLEIATFGRFSLIVRTNYINIYDGYGNYGNPMFQYLKYGSTNEYVGSNVQERINKWFAGGTMDDPNQGHDLLAMDANLRNFTVQNTALSAIGSGPVANGADDGFSNPIEQLAPFGDDTAFALSYGEAANFISKLFLWENGGHSESPELAQSNFDKITIPPGSSLYNKMWLRSPGNNKDNVSSLGLKGLVFQTLLSGGSGVDKDFGVVFPALWVESRIFDEVPVPVR